MAKSNKLNSALGLLHYQVRLMVPVAVTADYSNYPAGIVSHLGKLQRYLDKVQVVLDQAKIQAKKEMT